MFVATESDFALDSSAEYAHLFRIQYQHFVIAFGCHNS